MTTYTLLSSVNQVNALPPTPVIRPVPVDQKNSLAVLSGNLMDPALPIAPSQQQAYQLVVAGNASVAVSATVQVYGSNDKLNWIRIGNPITASGTTSATAGASSNFGYTFFGALLTAISGTGARATLTMNA